jgi:hypothetical protein
MPEGDIDPVALEARLTTLDIGQNAIVTGLGEVRDEVATQNGRLDVLENEELRAQARREMRARDLAALGITASIIPSLLAAVALWA